MTTEPDLLGLSIVCPPSGEGGTEIRPVVNGRDLLADLSPRGGEGGPWYVGAGPRCLLRRARPLRAAATPHEVRLGVAGCGLERCCGSLYVTVRRAGEHVVWAGWRGPADQDLDLPEFRFAADQYEAEVLRAEEDRGWEWPAAVVATLLEAGLSEREDWLARWECELEAVWASRAEPDRIEVVLRHPPGREETDLPWAQFLMTLPISAADPSAQAERLEAQLTAGDPRATAELCGGDNPEQLGYPWP
ncbi:hypothetical protein [Streptomyces sp. CBMA123]|uniref:hypothetical protein n=1 Tax=Streptomyces sp. CBMA123 TaxID=1896313 RepID=UPI0016619405|nr:hypothetical protein [Streptomyces sp. CBMA123]MBD0689811.1 hypothetical protein [Streptomyces sp. CBMA123]